MKKLLVSNTKSVKSTDIILAFFMIVFLSFVAFVPSQSDFSLLFIPLFGAFGIYFWVIYRRDIHWKFWLLIAFLIKLILVFSFPNLSDDIYRFSWDARLVIEGFSPYRYLPESIVDSGIRGIDRDLFDQLNSPQYYSVYPPINQFLFLLSEKLSFGYIEYHSIVSKLLLIGFDIFAVIGVLKLLKAFKLSSSKVLIYFLNPLLIIELNGNIHYEGVMISLFIWAVWFLYSNRMLLAGLLMALSVGVKLMPLLFFPLVLKYLWSHPKRNQFVSWYFIFGVIIFIPLFLGLDWQNFGESIDLYFQKFEFNASIYYVLRSIGVQITGYNMIQVIGPVLGLISLGILLWLSYKKTINSILDLFKWLLVFMTIFYLNATTIHPWYMSFLVVFSVFINVRFTLLWSLLIVLSYSHYNEGINVEHFGYILLEYFIVFYILVLDCKNFYKTSK